MQTCSLRLKAASTFRTPHSWILHSTRSVSTSPYGRTHVWKRRLPTLPNPVIPKYPQTVIRSDGTSFVQWTTSPKSLVRLTRDTTNNPVWNSSAWANERGLEDESASTGRMGRFSRKFGGVTMPAAEQQPSSSVQKKSDDKREQKGKGVDVGESEKDDVVDLTNGFGMGMGMGSVGMGGALDDVKWFEEMAGLTGVGEAKAPGEGKKKKPKK